MNNSNNEANPSPNAYQELKEAKDAAVMFCNKHNITATELAETVDRAQALADALQGLLEWHNTALGYGLGRKIEAATKALNAWNGNGQKKEGVKEQLIPTAVYKQVGSSVPVPTKEETCGHCGNQPGKHYIGNQLYLCNDCMETHTEDCY